MAKPTRHIQQYSPVYCHRLFSTVEYTQKHLETYCHDCPYLSGSAQGYGVECTWDDGTGRDISFNETPEQLARRGAQVMAKNPDRTREQIEEEARKAIAQEQA